jgi:uncharacterized protein (DUF433 family)
MSKRTLTQKDLREAPAYGIAEAAQYLRLPISTLRSWTVGQRYRVADEPRFFRPVIEIADRLNRKLSFINLIEAFVLAGIRREHSVPLPKVRRAVDYLRRRFGSPRPLAEEQFETDGVELFVQKFGELIGVSQEGQLAMRELLKHRLKYVKRDPSGIPKKLVLFPAPAAELKQGVAVIIDPRISFGRPVLDGFGVRTSILAERFDAGETIEELVQDYGVPSEAVQNALRCERRAA